MQLPREGMHDSNVSELSLKVLTKAKSTFYISSHENFAVLKTDEITGFPDSCICLFTLSFFHYGKLSIFLLYRYQNGILHKTKHP
jgi:hypothetical protein